MALYTDKMVLDISCGGIDFTVGDCYAVAVYGTLFGKTGWFWDGHKKQQAENDNMPFVGGYITVDGYSTNSVDGGSHHIVIDGTGYYIDDTGYIGTVEKIAVYEDHAPANWGNVSANAVFKAYDTDNTVKYSKSWELAKHSYGYDGGGHWVIINKTVDLYVDTSKLTEVPTVKIIPNVSKYDFGYKLYNKLKEITVLKDKIVKYPLYVYSVISQDRYTMIITAKGNNGKNYPVFQAGNNLEIRDLEKGFSDVDEITLYIDVIGNIQL